MAATRYSASDTSYQSTNFADMLAETLSNEAASAERRRDKRHVQGYSAIREKVLDPTAAMKRGLTPATTALEPRPADEQSLDGAPTITPLASGRCGTINCGYSDAWPGRSSWLRVLPR